MMLFFQFDSIVPTMVTQCNIKKRSHYVMKSSSSLFMNLLNNDTQI